jgi:hypothetical protein
MKGQKRIIITARGSVLNLIDKTNKNFDNF